jgi:hypothetical protein
MTSAEITNAIIGAFTALATLAAVVVAVLGIRHEARARQRAEARADAAEAARASDAAEREARDREAGRRHQADRVVAWADWVVDMELLGENAVGHWRIQITNASDLPVFDVVVVALGKDGGWQQNATARTLPPTTTRSVNVDMVGGGTRQEASDPVVRTRFRDAAGTVWERREDGVLTPLRD